jgi:hypothetical protein
MVSTQPWSTSCAIRSMRSGSTRNRRMRLVHWFLQQDVKDALGEATPGVSTVDFSSVRYEFLGRLPSFRGDVIAGPSDPTIT